MLMPDAKDKWADHAKRHLKAELKWADVNYAELARRPNEMGLPETEGSATVKINRGGVSGMVPVRRHAGYRYPYLARGGMGLGLLT